MAGARVQAVCGTCRRRETCQDAPTLDVLRGFIENSQIAAELALDGRVRYRLGCDRYRPDRRGRAFDEPRSEDRPVEVQP
jgi:hypothetical protein